MIIKHSAGGIVIHNNNVLTISWTTHEYICFPKGGIGKGEASEHAALREVKEETGYNVRIVEPLGTWTYRYSENGTDYAKSVDYYLMELADDSSPAPAREPGEDFENEWFDIDEAAEKLTLDDARDAFNKAVKIVKGQ